MTFYFTLINNQCTLAKQKLNWKCSNALFAVKVDESFLKLMYMTNNLQLEIVTRNTLSNIFKYYLYKAISKFSTLSRNSTYGSTDK